MPRVALFLSAPAALWLLLLAVPVLAAHLVRRRRVRVVVPHLPLLMEARGVSRGAGLGRRLVEHAPLACRLLALGAIVLALAGARPAAPAEPVPLVIVLDRDVTGAARESDGRSRWEHALGLAAALVRAHADGPVSLVVAEAAPRVLAQGEPEREALARRLAAPSADLARAGPTRADLEAALGLAFRLAGARGRVQTLTARALPAVYASNPRLVALGTGASDEDQGFVDLALRVASDGLRARLELRVLNFGPRPARRTVALEVEGLEPQRHALELAAGAEAEVAFEVLVPRGGAAAVARLEGADAFALDDRLEVVLAGPLRPSVLAVHAGGGLRPYTAAALAALGERVDREASGGVALADLRATAARDVTVVDGVALPAGALTPGAWLFLGPLSGALPFEVGASVERPIVWRARAGHPLVLDLDLAEAWIRQATPLRPAPDVEGLAFAAEDQPVLAEGERDGVRWVALGLDPEGSDLPIRAAFPLLVRNAILRLARAPVEALPPFVRAGERLRARMPLPGGPDARVAWPGRPPQAERLGPEVGVLVPPGLAGLASVSTGPQAQPTFRGRTAVVDLDRERSIVPARPPASAPAPRATPEEPGRLWGRVLASLGALLLALDLLLTRRKRSPGSGP